MCSQPRSGGASCSALRARPAAIRQQHNRIHFRLSKSASARPNNVSHVNWVCIVRLEPGGQEVIARAGNYEICKAAFDKGLFVYPTEHLELRQGARVICKSKEG
jgi:hypothetical protein